MKDRTPEQLKGQIRNFTYRKKLQSQEVLQMFLLERLSKSEYANRTILDNEEISVMAYNIETIVAEKYETIIRRNIGTSRARDFYDLYKFFNIYNKNINFKILKLAVMETSKNRNSEKEIDEWKEIVQDMKEDYNLMRLWDNYCKNNSYAVGILFEDVINVVEKVAEILASV